MLDALWSDPKLEPGVKANVLRGGGCCFGLKQNKLYIIFFKNKKLNYYK